MVQQPPVDVEEHGNLAALIGERVVADVFARTLSFIELGMHLSRWATRNQLALLSDALAEAGVGLPWIASWTKPDLPGGMIDEHQPYCARAM